MVATVDLLSGRDDSFVLALVLALVPPWAFEDDDEGEGEEEGVMIWLRPRAALRTLRLRERFFLSLVNGYAAW